MGCFQLAGKIYSGKALVPWIGTAQTLEVRVPSDTRSIYFLLLRRYLQFFEAGEFSHPWPRDAAPAMEPQQKSHVGNPAPSCFM